MNEIIAHAGNHGTSTEGIIMGLTFALMPILLLAFTFLSKKQRSKQ